MKIRFLRIVSYYGLLPAFLLASCSSPETGWKGRMEVEGSVTIVSNPSTPIYPGDQVDFQEDLAISSGKENEEWIFQQIRTLDVDESGNIYVLDEQAADIKIFDSAGNFVRKIGRKGQGSGELMMPVSMIYSPDKRIVINDMGQQALIFFDLEGNYLRQISFAGKFQFVGPRITSKGNIIGSFLVPAEKPTAELVIFDSDFHPLRTIISLPVTPPPVLNIFAARSMTGLRWVLGGGENIYWGDFLQDKYALHIHNDNGDHIRTVIRDYQTKRITEADRNSLLKKMFGDNPPPAQWDIRFPENYPPFSGFSVDDEGRIYVKTYEKSDLSDEGNYDVFDSEGRFVCRFSLEVPLMAIKRGFLTTIVEDENGFQVVKRFIIKWKMEF